MGELPGNPFLCIFVLGWRWNHPGEGNFGPSSGSNTCPRVSLGGSSAFTPLGETGMCLEGFFLPLYSSCRSCVLCHS